MKIKWLVISSISFSVGLTLNLIISRNIKQATLTGLLSVPATALSVLVTEHQRLQKLNEEHKIQAEKTYNKLLAETQESVNQFAQRASERVLDLESNTIREATVFESSEPEFTTFSEALSAERARRSKIAKLTTANTPEESKILAAQYMGMSPEEIAREILDDDSEDAIAQVKKVIADCSKDCK